MDDIIEEGYGGAFFSFGITGIIAACKLLFKKGIDGKPFYSLQAREHAKTIFIISIFISIAFLCGVALIIRFFAGCMDKFFYIGKTSLKGGFLITVRLRISRRN